ncbi:MAG: glycosyltransferase [Patescibacteria group bacterium]|jgi:UDP-N-acetylglucosamine--N-acetylmuramyl-(pentapeptide) pyrophosphoryl-undecaprenol N-acetylglucosamine transferase
MKILLVGGGTLGSVNPLLAIASAIKIKDTAIDIVFWGSKNPFEKQFVEEYGFELIPIPSGKYRRYFSFLNIMDFFKIIYAGFFVYQKLKIMKPDWILTAGSFVAVPVAWAAKKLNLKVLMYQQDAELGMANKYISKIAVKRIATAGLIAKNIPGESDTLGFAIRKELLFGRAENTYRKYNLNPQKPVLLVIGGSSGALSLNHKFVACIKFLPAEIQILHITGVGKSVSTENRQNYHSISFTNNELPDLYAAANFIVSRAGSNALAELVALKKPALIVPLPNTQQEKNAEYLHACGGLVISQDKLEPEIFAKIIAENILNPEKLEILSRNIANIWQTDGADKIAELILKTNNVTNR